MSAWISGLRLVVVVVFIELGSTKYLRNDCQVSPSQSNFQQDAVRGHVLNQQASKIGEHTPSLWQLPEPKLSGWQWWSSVLTGGMEREGRRTSARSEVRLKNEVIDVKWGNMADGEKQHTWRIYSQSCHHTSEICYNTTLTSWYFPFSHSVKHFSQSIFITAHMHRHGKMPIAVSFIRSWGVKSYSVWN